MNNVTRYVVIDVDRSKYISCVNNKYIIIIER